MFIVKFFYFFPTFMNLELKFWNMFDSSIPSNSVTKICLNTFVLAKSKGQRE
jgi:hypothetical protein